MSSVVTGVGRRLELWRLSFRVPRRARPAQPRTATEDSFLLGFLVISAWTILGRVAALLLLLSLFLISGLVSEEEKPYQGTETPAPTQAKGTMAASAPLRSLEEEVTCSICLDYLRDPVTIDCGHVFCRSCTGDIRPISGSRPVCPLCKKPFKKENIRPVWQLASLVENIERLKVDSGRQPGELAREPQDIKLCERHQEKLHYYCEDDGKLLCVMCRESREHRPHTAVLVEKAALPHRVSPGAREEGRSVWCPACPGSGY